MTTQKHLQKKTKGIILAAAAAAVVVLIALLGNKWNVIVTVNGKTLETVEAGSKFQDEGATATAHSAFFPLWKKENLPVSTEGQVDPGKLGTTEITYSASYRGASGKAIRTVKVKDTTPPEITLVQTPDSYTTIGQKYEEEGYTATDSFEGDLTAKVKREEQSNGDIRYTVTDSSGNETSKVRKVVYDDRTAPKISLSGGKNYRVLQGSKFHDGYTATDDVDGDLTAKVSVSGQVDVSTPGTYTMTYTVTDAHDNKATAERTVQVISKDALPGIEKVVYLTFDDGPGEYTQQLLDILAKHGAFATFFVTNQFPNYQGMLAKEAEAGHAVAVHTYSHNYAQVYASTGAFWGDYEKMQAVIAQQTGQRSSLMRFPGGSSNMISRKYCPGIMTALTQEAGQRGYTYFDWNVDSTDASGHPQKDTIANAIIQGMQTHNQAVVLCHDIHKQTIEAMDQVLTYGEENGYLFAPLSANSPGAHHGVNN